METHKFVPIRISFNEYLEEPLNNDQIAALTGRVHKLKVRNEKYRSYVLKLIFLVFVSSLIQIYLVSNNEVAWFNEGQEKQLFVLLHPVILSLLAFLWFDWPTGLINSKTLPSIELSGVEFINVSERIGGAYVQIDACTIRGNYGHIEKIKQFLKRIEGRQLLRFEARLLQYVVTDHSYLVVEPAAVTHTGKFKEAFNS